MELTDWSLTMHNNYVKLQGVNDSKSGYVVTSALQSVDDNAVNVTTASKTKYNLKDMNKEFQTLWSDMSQIAILRAACRHNAVAPSAKQALEQASHPKTAMSGKFDNKHEDTEQAGGPVVPPLSVDIKCNSAEREVR